MGAFYGGKILVGGMNEKTGQQWCIEDVPSYWREKTEKWLESA